MVESMFPTKINSIGYEVSTEIFTSKFGNSTKLLTLLVQTGSGEGKKIKMIGDLLHQNKIE
jgi:hypothetical protein